MTPVRALIAEDEPLLAQGLERELRAAWPELAIVARAADGPTATAAALAQLPDVMFLDIQMPGASGLEVAAEVADEWPDEWPDDRPDAAATPAPPPPLVVFVTAFEHYAVAAFERAAVDYLLKPVTSERLAATVARLRERLAQRQAPQAAQPGANAALVRQMQAVAGAPQPTHSADAADALPDKIRVVRAAVGHRVRMIPLAEVVCFEAADKYVNVVTEAGEALVRVSLRELSVRLEGVEFTQVHRSVLVNAERITGAERDEAGHYWLTLRGLARPLKVSRAFSHLFRPM